MVWSNQDQPDRESVVAIRMRRSFKVAPGIRLNVSKSGVSTSIGPRGAKVNIGKKGTRVTGSIPGTGISATHLFRKPVDRPQRAASVNPSTSSGNASSWAWAMFGAAGFLIAFLAGGMMAFWGGLLGVVSAGILLFKHLLRNR